MTQNFVLTNLFMCREVGCDAVVYSNQDGGKVRVQHGENREHSRMFNPRQGLLHFEDDEGMTVFQWLEAIHRVEKVETRKHFT